MMVSLWGYETEAHPTVSPHVYQEIPATAGHDWSSLSLSSVWNASGRGWAGVTEWGSQLLPWIPGGPLRTSTEGPVCSFITGRITTTYQWLPRSPTYNVQILPVQQSRCQAPGTQNWISSVSWAHSTQTTLFILFYPLWHYQKTWNSSEYSLAY